MGQIRNSDRNVGPRFRDWYGDWSEGSQDHSNIQYGSTFKEYSKGCMWWQPWGSPWKDMASIIQQGAEPWPGMELYRNARLVASTYQQDWSTITAPRGGSQGGKKIWHPRQVIIDHDGDGWFSGDPRLPNNEAWFSHQHWDFNGEEDSYSYGMFETYPKNGTDPEYWIFGSRTWCKILFRQDSDLTHVDPNLRNKRSTHVETVFHRLPQLTGLSHEEIDLHGSEFNLFNENNTHTNCDYLDILLLLSGCLRPGSNNVWPYSDQNTQFHGVTQGHNMQYPTPPKKAVGHKVNFNPDEAYTIEARWESEWWQDNDGYGPDGETMAMETHDSGRKFAISVGKNIKAPDDDPMFRYSIRNVWSGTGSNKLDSQRIFTWGAKEDYPGWGDTLAETSGKESFGQGALEFLSTRHGNCGQFIHGTGAMPEDAVSDSRGDAAHPIFKFSTNQYTNIVASSPRAGINMGYFDLEVARDKITEEDKTAPIYSVPTLPVAVHRIFDVDHETTIQDGGSPDATPGAKDGHWVIKLKDTTNFPKGNTPYKVSINGNLYKLLHAVGQKYHLLDMSGDPLSEEFLVANHKTLGKGAKISRKEYDHVLYFGKSAENPKHNFKHATFAIKDKQFNFEHAGFKVGEYVSMPTGHGANSTTEGERQKIKVIRMGDETGWYDMTNIEIGNESGRMTDTNIDGVEDQVDGIDPTDQDVWLRIPQMVLRTDSRLGFIDVKSADTVSQRLVNTIWNKTPAGAITENLAAISESDPSSTVKNYEHKEFDVRNLHRCIMSRKDSFKFWQTDNDWKERSTKDMTWHKDNGNKFSFNKYSKAVDIEGGDKPLRDVVQCVKLGNKGFGDYYNVQFNKTNLTGMTNPTKTDPGTPIVYRDVGKLELQVRLKNDTFPADIETAGEVGASEASWLLQLTPKDATFRYEYDQVDYEIATKYDLAPSDRASPVPVIGWKTSKTESRKNSPAIAYLPRKGQWIKVHDPVSYDLVTYYTIFHSGQDGDNLPIDLTARMPAYTKVNNAIDFPDGAIFLNQAHHYGFDKNKGEFNRSFYGSEWQDDSFLKENYVCPIRDAAGFGAPTSSGQPAEEDTSSSTQATDPVDLTTSKTLGVWNDFWEGLLGFEPEDFDETGDGVQVAIYDSVSNPGSGNQIVIEMTSETEEMLSAGGNMHYAIVEHDDFEYCYKFTGTLATASGIDKDFWAEMEKPIEEGGLGHQIWYPEISSTSYQSKSYIEFRSRARPVSGDTKLDPDEIASCLDCVVSAVSEAQCKYEGVWEVTEPIDGEVEWVEAHTEDIYSWHDCDCKVAINKSGYMVERLDEQSGDDWGKLKATFTMVFPDGTEETHEHLFAPITESNPSGDSRMPSGLQIARLTLKNPVVPVQIPPPEHDLPSAP